ncbi:peptide deformylase [Geomicrobium sp. JCM 19039]|uniref:peptide deformylase n=1 Tax=Geomicrobium sp. JCM 19039 TaxID=1460636 RepID=UPI00045F361C|nr:peptide deformylase [Geomicrobium sp. JCM 19039]GAK14456.1 peptide deformylase [Geomicrobium sp. JCM 19039]
MILMDNIVREGSPVLREVAKEVDMPASEEDLALLQDMLDYLKNSQDPEIAEKYDLRPGSGLAAPQVGVSKRMFAIHTTDEKDQLYSYGFINPKIVSHSIEETSLENGEGCLSVDREVEGEVPRYARVKLQADTLEGERVTLRLRGYLAIVVQHEMDHLNGIMFYDRIEGYAGPHKKEVPRTAL